MSFQSFELEHYQSLYEHSVEYNLADSSVKCVTLREWLADDEIEQLLGTSLAYPEVNGTASLRAAIATLYPGATAENVLVTVGASEANALTCATLLEPGDAVIVVSPGYRQVWGLAKNAGCRVTELPLRPEDGWRLDLDELGSLAERLRPKLIALANPNNPTGSVLSREEMQRIVEVCERTGAWLHADEVYCGTELEGGETPSFWGSYPRLVCTNSLSKAYGLAGLRIGWGVADPELIQALWRRHEYAVIAASAPSMKLAGFALQPHTRASLLERQRGLARGGRRVLTGWIAQQDGLFSWTPTPATSICFVRYHLELPSMQVAEHIRQRESVLIAPGSTLGAEHHLRITIGYEPEKVRAALERIGTAVAELAAELAAAQPGSIPTRK
jgi:aspartate/methionine/tyrosine aminotransferase